MGRFVLPFALALTLIGCSSTEKKQPEPGDVTIPGGSASQIEGPEKPGPAEADLPGVLDMPLYPGAKIASNTVGEMGGEKRYHVKLETPDSAKKVGEFYSKNGLSTEVKGTQGQFMGSTKKGNNVLMFIEEKDGKTSIQIRLSPAAH
jgi:hypothetical protein